VRSVYLDTSVPSFLATTRGDPASVVRREITQTFWRQGPPAYRLFVSELVVAELSAGDWPGRDRALAAIAAIPSLAVTPEVTEVALVYLRSGLLPVGSRADAAHLACASVHGMEVLLTWNVRHLANPAKVEHLAAINRRLGLATPMICTPEALLEAGDE
jgi:hypothetical protein